MSRMGSSRLWGKIIVLVAVWCCALSAQAKYSGGSGTEAEPFRISAVPDWQELMATPADWESRFVLTADIDLNDVPITPVGNITNEFTGVFDGNDFDIRNADVNMPGSDYVALFGYLGTDGQIKNLAVEDISILGRSRVGGLVGFGDGGTISNCYLTGSVSGADSVGGTGDSVGGLVGFSDGGTISNCYSNCSVSSAGYGVGGLVGGNYGGSITNCYSSGSVSGTSYVGGLVGHNYGGIITNCYSTGSVSGYGEVGGLLGPNYEGIITNCYSTGSVSGTYYVGGLVGGNWRGTISNCYSRSSVTGTHSPVGGLVGHNGYYEFHCETYCDDLHCWEQCWEDCWPGWIYKCYSTGKVSGGGGVGGLVGVHGAGEVGDSCWDIETSEQSSSAGGTPETTAEMKTQSTFTSAGWDFIEVWDIGENQTYPFLRTYLAGDINHDGVVDFRDIAYLAESWLRGV